MYDQLVAEGRKHHISDALMKEFGEKEKPKEKKVEAKPKAKPKGKK